MEYLYSPIFMEIGVVFRQTLLGPGQFWGALSVFLVETTPRPTQKETTPLQVFSIQNVFF